MEPYSADRIKREKRKYPQFSGGSVWPTTITFPFKLFSRTIKNIYNGTERMVFKKRNIH